MSDRTRPIRPPKPAPEWIWQGAWLFWRPKRKAPAARTYGDSATMASGLLLVRVCPVAGGDGKTLVLCDRHGHPLPNQVEVRTDATRERAVVTVTFAIDGSMVQWA